MSISGDDPEPFTGPRPRVQLAGSKLDGLRAWPAVSCNHCVMSPLRITVAARVRGRGPVPLRGHYRGSTHARLRIFIRFPDGVKVLP